MMAARRINPAGAAKRDDEAAALGIAKYLSLAAAPAFALMALLTAALGQDPMHALCVAGHASSLGGMVPMYALMSGFHLAPWLKLIALRRGAGTG